MKLYAGLDWGAFEHAVCVVNEKGTVQVKFVVKHDADGLKRLIDKLGAVTSEKVPVAIERPDGIVVDALVEAGHAVVPMHPNAVAACRPRYRAAGGKSDVSDAFLLADVLRTDGHRFAVLEPPSDADRALRAQVRIRDDLVRLRVQTTNQLRSLLESFWPGATAIFKDLDSPISLAFLERYPTPEAARALGEKRMGAFLVKHAYAGRKAPIELLDRMRNAPEGRAGSAEMAAKHVLVQSLVAVLKTLTAKIAELGKAVEAAVAASPSGRIVQSLPRAGSVNAAQIAVELGDAPRRFASADHLAAVAGVVPVTHASGQSRGVVFRHACNHRLRRALTCFADNSRHASSWAADIYQRARARGRRHPHAVRILARAWCRVLWRCLVDGVPYNPERHGAIARGAAA